MDIYEFRSRGESGVEASVEDLARDVIGACIEVHRELGAGLPEVAYKNALSHQLTLRGIAHEAEARVPVYYKEVLVAEGRVDILVDKRLVVELKVVDSLNDVHRAQVLAYLNALRLLINFNVVVLKDGIKRVVLTR